MFSTDFSSTDLSIWYTNGGSWSVVSGALVQVGDYGTGNHPTVPLPGDLTQDGILCIHSTISFTNGYIEANATSTDNDGMGLVLRYVDDNNYYRFDWHAEESVLRIIKRISGSNYFLTGSASYGYTSNQSYLIKFEVNSTTLSVDIDGTTRLSTTDTDLTYGKAGLYCWHNNTTIFDNVVLVSY